MGVDSGNAVDVTDNEQKIIQAAYHIQALLMEQQLKPIEARAALNLCLEFLNRKE